MNPIEPLDPIITNTEIVVQSVRRYPVNGRTRAASDEDRLRHFVDAQRLNTYRDITALRPFKQDEFGTGAASPSQAHLAAANDLMSRLRKDLLTSYAGMKRVTERARQSQSSDDLKQLLRYKELINLRMKRLEGVWQFYLELFSQRQAPFASILLAADRIALDCYQVTYTGLGMARSIPAPPPLSYMETGHTPATYRRGVILTRLNRQANPFPIVSLPYHRLHNPWTLGAIHHEVAHNLQSDLGLWDVVPQRIKTALLNGGLSARVAEIWQQWHKETWADLCGVLLGGPAVVVSLLDVLARTPHSTSGFNPQGVHPTPLLRAQINFHLLRRLGFENDAMKLEGLWRRLYPEQGRDAIPSVVLDSFPQAVERVVSVIVYEAYPQLGGKSLHEVIPFKTIYLPMIQEAGQRLAGGTDPGIIPERFLVAAARYALERRLATPEQIHQNFYRALGNR
jgi:hypothetical protein